MRIKVISFTKKGIELSVLLKEKLAQIYYKRNRVACEEDIFCKLFTVCKNADSLPPHVTYTNESLTSFAEDAFKHYDGMIYIGACGIAVRSIAPFVKDKFEDIPVLVMDEASNAVIPILSGHLGGANRLARVIAKEMNLQAVITTATDLHKKFTVDLFASDNDLRIEKREGIAAVSAKVLAEEEITVCVEDTVHPMKPEDEPSAYGDGLYRNFIRLIPYEKNVPADILISSDKERSNALIVLRPRDYVVGIGCKRGTSADKIERFIEEVFRENGLDENRICAIASIDLKKKEDGIHQFARKHKIPFLFYDAETLMKLKGDFSASDFVKEKTGTDNVCERSAVRAAGEGGEIILSKTAKDGITVSVVKKVVHIGFGEDEKDYYKKREPDEKKEERKSDNGIIYAIGIGPGAEEMMTAEASEVLEKSDVIVGYPVYLELLPERFRSKKLLSTPMRKEKERCILAFEEAEKGQTVSMVCSGDAGIYGMAALLYEIGEDYPGISVEVIPGITAATSGAALLGAPLNHDFCVISLSDLLTPWEKITKRLRTAAEGDFAIAIYNPSSKKRADYLKKACEILLETIEPGRPCGYVRNIGRKGCEVHMCTLNELKDREVDMFTTVFIGNSGSEIINGRLVTKRGYRVE